MKKLVIDPTAAVKAFPPRMIRVKRRRRSIRDEVAASLGLIKVRGTVSGKTFYE